MANNIENNYTNDPSVGVNTLIAKAVANPENINEDGSINWNFVDADIHIWNSTWNLGFSDDELHHGLNDYNHVPDGYVAPCSYVFCSHNVL